MIIYKPWGTNSFGYPEAHPKTVNKHFSGDTIPEGWQEITEENLDTLLVTTQDAAKAITNQIIQDEITNSTYAMTGLTNVDTNQLYNVVLSRDNIVYEKINNKRAVTTTYTKDSMLAVKESKIYDYSENTNYPSIETLKIDYYNTNGAVLKTKEVITVLCFADSEKAQARVNTAKMGNVKQLIISKKFIDNNPIDIAILNNLVVVQSLAFTANNSPQPLLSIFNDFTNYVNGLTTLTNDDKINILALLDTSTLTTIINIIND